MVFSAISLFIILEMILLVVAYSQGPVQAREL